MPRFAIEIVKRKAPRPEPSFRTKLLRLLRSGLTSETAFFAVPSENASLGVMAGVPDLIFVHRGRAFGLELKSKSSSLSGEQRAAQLVLRGAGMRVEVARDLDEALMHLRDMGIPLCLRGEDAFRRVRAA